MIILYVIFKEIYEITNKGTISIHRRHDRQFKLGTNICFNNNCFVTGLIDA